MPDAEGLLNTAATRGRECSYCKGEEADIDTDATGLWLGMIRG